MRQEEGFFETIFPYFGKETYFSLFGKKGASVLENIFANLGTETEEEEQ